MSPDNQNYLTRDGEGQQYERLVGNTQIRGSNITRSRSGSILILPNILILA